MKSGGPWNLFGLRSKAGETAEEPARQSGPSVGEWLNKVIQSGATEDSINDRSRRPSARDGSGPDRSGIERYAGRPYRGDRNRSEATGIDAAVAAKFGGTADPGQDDEAMGDALHAREKLGNVHTRLDELTQQLDRLSRAPVGRRGSAPAGPEERNERRRPQMTGRANGAPVDQQRTLEPVLLIDQAVAEITQRQRALDGEATTPLSPESRSPGAADMALATPAPNVAGGAAALDFSGLEDQLRQITSRIGALAPACDIEKAMAAIRTDLAEIARQLNEALPRRALESIETDIKALGERIDHSRQSGVDPSALAGLEHGLSEVREALRTLTPAENLVGFEEAVNALAQKLDLILARDDPSALQQLEAAIGGLRGIVSHVASNDTLTKVAEEVRTLAAQVDNIADNAATGHAVSAIEQRLDTLVGALTASSEAGHAVPRDLEKLLAGLIEKLEWVQLTHTDHAALAHLEDRIATLVQRFDASDARLSHLEAIERGLADLLVHIEQMRDIHGLMPAASQGVGRDAVENKETERRTQDSLEAIQGTVEHVIERLASIESGLRGDATRGSIPASLLAPVSPQPIRSPDLTPSLSEAAPSAPVAPPAAASQTDAAAARAPIDPTLPPDHPLEPRSAVASAKPPVIADAERPNFIAAARRAAQAAAWDASGQKATKDVVAQTAAAPGRISQRLRKLIAAGAVILILIGGVSIATRLFDADGPAAPAQLRPEQTPPSTNAPQAPLHVVPVKPAPLQGSPTPSANPALAKPPDSMPDTGNAKPERQSMAPVESTAPQTAAVPWAPGSRPVATAMPSWATPDITGALPPQASLAAMTPSPHSTTASFDQKLPATIGNPALRKAALAGNPAAAYVVATRFADGRGVLQNSEAAAYWFERASRAGLAPAEFRLGGLYEKGIGVPKNLAKARDLYLAAAQKGNGNAMHNLAVLYAEGFDGQPDYDQAAHWFRKGADHGIGDSQYNLGILYARGIGVAKNDSESYKWFALAANQGDKEATKKRDEIASRLDTKSLAAARLAVKNWSPEPQPEDAINVTMEKAWNQPAKTSRKQKSEPSSAPTPG